MALMGKILMSVIGLVAAGCCCDAMKCAEEGGVVRVLSPDSRNEIRLRLDPLSYEVLRDGCTLVNTTPIGMKIDGACLASTCKSSPKVTTRDVTGSEPSPVYKKASIDLSAREAFVDYGDWGVRLAARNDGVAYRFEISKKGRVKVDCEKASLNVPAKARCWMNRTSEFGLEETVPEAAVVEEIKTDGRRMVYLPFVYKTAGKVVAVTESDVYDYPVWNLKKDEKAGDASFRSHFAPAPRTKEHAAGWGKDRVVFEKGGRWISVTSSHAYLVETSGTRTFPWRTFIVVDDFPALCQSDAVRALARPAAKGADFSWVKPGKVAWDWWNAFDNKGKSGCNTETYIRFIDFAAANDIEYVIFDEGWSEKLNIWKYHPSVDVPRLVDYANKKGVGIILWMAWAQAYGEEEKVVAHFAKLGVKGFKVDFMDRGDAEIAVFLDKFAAACAKHSMIVDYHGVYRPTGMSRAYPNIVNYEGIHGLEQTKWYGRNKYDFMANDVRAFFLRLTAGPMDYTPGAMDNYPIDAYKGTNANPGSMGTRCRQMAMMALYEAPLQMLCDAPTKYEKNIECFRFMAGVPVVWDETVGVGGCPDTYAAVARKAADGSWYAAAISDSSPRQISLDTSKFLLSGRWKAEIFRDAPDADRTPTAYVHETVEVKAGEKLLFKTAPGGGFIVKFTVL